jgi:hypothetical protein
MTSQHAERASERRESGGERRAIGDERRESGGGPRVNAGTAERNGGHGGGRAALASRQGGGQGAGAASAKGAHKEVQRWGPTRAAEPPSTLDVVAE